MAANNETAARRALMLQRQAAALELRRAGTDYRQIGQTLNISRSSAHRLVVQALAEARATIETAAHDLKAEEVSRLDGLMLGLWTKAKAGNLGAVAAVLKVMERRAKLLGLDAPVKLAHAGQDGGPIAVRNDGIDLRHLTDAQLDQYEALCIAAAAAASAGSAGAGAPAA